MKKILVASLAAAAFASTAALAADLPVKAPIMKAPPPVASWTGCYLDGGAGYGMYDEHTQLLNAAGVPTNVTLDQGGKGWLGRVGAGCDLQLTSMGLSNWVIGVFGDYDFENIHGAHTGGNGSIGLISGDMNLRDSWVVGGRLGYLVTPSLLTYFDGGYTEARFDGIGDYVFASGIPAGVGVPSATYHGWFIGGGTEYAFNWLPIQGLFWRNEYRFAEYQSQNLVDFVVPTGAPNGVLEATHPYVQTITTSLVWRFNWGGPVTARY